MKMNSIPKRMMILLLSAPIAATAAPVTYAFTGTSNGGLTCSARATTLVGTITIDFANENPSQSTGIVGSPGGWTSSSSGGILTNTPAPKGLVFSIKASCQTAPVVDPFFTSSSVTVGRAGINGNYNYGGIGASANCSIGNPGGATSANGLPLFDAGATGVCILGEGVAGFNFTVNSLVLVPPSLSQQLDALVTEAGAVAPEGFEDKANKAQTHVQAACTPLESFVREVEEGLAREVEGKKGTRISQQAAAQLIFDATTAELQIGCN